MSKNTDPKAPKTILVTGCSSGIGRSAAEELTRRGYRVFATARREEEVSALRAAGLESLRLDLDDSESIHRCVDEVLERTGGTLYALFNNAAYGQPGAVEDLTREVLRAQFESNVFGTVELTNRVIPVMRAQGYGRIIQNSSVLGLIVLPFRGAYNATKFALEALSDTLRLELAGTGIHVALIEPGPINTHFRANAYAAYKRNIDPHASVHRNIYRALESRLTQEGAAAPFTLPPEAVVRKLLHALEHPRPKLRYYVTFPTYFFAFLKRVLPARSLDRVVAHVSRAESR
jgi:Short-chain dehydrogenases of various substrate specificities